MRRALLLMMMTGLAWAAVAQPMVLDTDIGDDIDDTWALAMLLQSPDADVRLITTATGNTPARTRLAAKLLETLSRTDIPLGTGVQDNAAPLHQAAWLGDYTLDDYPGTVHEDGVQALIDALRAAEEKMTLLTIGPLTNLAAALERAPDIAQRARVVAMAGSVDVGYGGRDTPQAEWNVRRDVAAAQRVFAAPWEITLAPLDLCGTLHLAGPRYAAVAQSDAPAARAVIANYEAWTRRGQFPQDASSVLFDCAAVYLAQQEALANIETIPLTITPDGYTRRDPENGRPVRVGLNWTDRAAIEQRIVDRLTTTRD